MRNSSWRKCSAITVVCGTLLTGQTKVDLRTQGKSVDFSNATATKPARVGSSLPSTCGQGEFFFLTTAPAGQNVYGCSAANIWSPEGAAIPQTSLVPNELNNTGFFLTTDGNNPLWQPLGGDLNGTPSAVSVTGLQGRPVANTVPADGQLLGWSAAATKWLPVSITAPPNFGTSFSGTTVMAIPGTRHNLNTANLIVSCYDSASPANLIEPSHITIDQITYDVAVSFAQPQTGRCVVNGSGGQSSGGSGAGSYSTGSASLTFSAIPNGGCSTEQNLSVPAANPGNGIASGWPALPQGLLGMMRVSAAGTVSVRLCNLSGTSATVPALVYLATVVSGS